MSTTTKTVDVALKLIAPHPSNPRRDVGDLSELSASIKNRGILQNLVVAPAPEGTKKPAEYVLIAGHRRLAAAKAAKLKTVPVNVREDLTEPADQLAAMLEENGHRTDLTPVEESDAVQGLLDLGLSQTQIASLTGMKKTRVSERARLAKLPAEVTEKVHTHQVTLTDALAVAEFDGRPDLQERVIAALGGDDYNFRWEIERGRRQLEAEKEHVAQRKELVKAGVTVLAEAPAEPDVDDYDTPRQWWSLEDLLDNEPAIDEAVSKHLELDADDVDWDQVEKWHQDTCEGHAVYEDDRYPSGATWSAICTTPDVHADLLTEGSAGSPDNEGLAAAAEQVEAIQRERAERAKQAEDMAIAARVRRAHVAEVIDYADLGLAHEVAERAVTAQVEQFHLTNEWDKSRLAVLASCLGLASTTAPAEVKDHALAVVKSASLARLVLLGMVLDNLTAERGMDGTDQWNWQSPGAQRWSRLLGGPLAYEWSEVELGLLPATVTDDDESVPA